MAALAGACAGLIVLLLSAGWRSESLRGEVSVAAHGQPGRGWRWLVGAAVLLGLAAVGGALAGGRGAALGLCAGQFGLLGWRLADRGPRQRRERVARAQLVSGCELLAGRLRTGLVPTTALVAVAEECPAFAVPVAEIGVGAEAPAALRRASEGAGGGVLRELAAAWDVAIRTGASLTDSIDSLAERVRSDHEVERVVAAELAAPRATGRLLAVLPLVGLGLGYLLGGDPLAFLAGSAIGQLCLVLGSLLAVLGILWNERLADRAGGG